MEQLKTSKIQKFWNEQPVGNSLVVYKNGKAFYEEYDEFRYRTEGHILKELDEIDLEGKKTLEIGLGQGADSMQIIERGAIFYGIDITEESVRRVKERFKIFNKEYREILLGNAEQLPFEDASFDVIYSHGVIHHSPNIEKVVKEIHRVLVPGGKAIIMVYHKRSINYYVSIVLIRRIGFLILLIFPFLKKLISRIVGEPIERFNKHFTNFKKEGFSYLEMKNFIHRSTDGPDNVFSSVWTKKSVNHLFKDFSVIKTDLYFLNERHFFGLQKILPKSWKRNLASRYGWHLWVKATK